MGRFNPAYAIIVPFLFLFTVPLAIFAGITTTLAFTVLIFRVLLVYVDVVLSLLPSYLTFRPRHRRHPLPYDRTVISTKTPASMSPASPLHRSRSPSPVLGDGARSMSLNRVTPYHHNHRRRRPSSASAGSLTGSVTPIASESGYGLVPSVGIDRDFEGIGGWRVGNTTDDDRWTMINSRLELPDRQYHGGRHHYRTPSGGGLEGGYLMMKGRSRNRSGSPDTVVGVAAPRHGGQVSPNSTRVRSTGGGNFSPLTTRDSADTEYFPIIAVPRKKVAAV